MRKVVEIPKDEEGNPILPIQIGSFQLISLGKVELRDGYYNERYIWPVGYCIKRYEREGRFSLSLYFVYMYNVCYVVY